MKSSLTPFCTIVDFQTGACNPPGQVVRRKLSQIQGIFADQAAAERAARVDDYVIYEVYNMVVPEDDGHLQHCSSIIYPGKVGDEYHMTKGHYHARADTAEIYICLQGTGYLLMETREGESSAFPMFPGAMLYIPPYWAHRTVNTGDTPLVFLGVYPGDAGHDYGTIEETGFRKQVVERHGKPAVIDNPRYQR